MIKRISMAGQLIRNMGFGYVVFRIWRMFQEKSGLLKCRFVNSEKSQILFSLNHWKQSEVEFFFNGKPHKSKMNVLTNSQLEELHQQVKKIKENNFQYFSSEWYRMADWHTNPETGFTYDAKQHWSEIPDFSAEAGDIKYVWEKSRFTFLYTLIRYDLHSGDDQSAAVFAFIENWIVSNPINLGPNWRCSQEISLRVLNWTFALFYYRASGNLSPNLFNLIANSIYRQILHVERYINFSLIAVRNNHAITETLALYLTSLLFLDFPNSKTRSKRAKKWFEKEISYQIAEDGTYLQHSMNYHRVVVQLLSWGIKLSELNGDRLSHTVYGSAAKSLEFLLACQDIETGKLPNYGNNDGALFFPLSGCEFLDFRPQLGALSRVLGKHNTIGAQYLAGDWQEETLWLGLNRKAEVLNPKSKASIYASGGYYVLREDSVITFLKCGSYKKHRPFQADNLHLDIWVNGENILRDSGTFQYNTSEEWGRYFAGTAGHNTVTIGNYDQMQKGPRFIWYYWIRRAEGKWTETVKETIFEGNFEGFRQLGKGIVHTRKVTKANRELKWTIEDQVTNLPANQEMRQTWHVSDYFWQHFGIKAYDRSGEELEGKVTTDWLSENYGHKNEGRQIVFSSMGSFIRTNIYQIGLI